MQKKFFLSDLLCLDMKPRLSFFNRLFAHYVAFTTFAPLHPMNLGKAKQLLKNHYLCDAHLKRFSHH